MATGATELSSLPLSPSLREKLLKAGFRTAYEVQEVSPSQLAQELGCSMEEAASIFERIREANDLSSTMTFAAVSALDLLQREEEQRGISTGCSEIDQMLGTGVALSKITEFCGAPGIGKTQLGMQLSINVQLPYSVGGCDGEAIYIDTEGSFIVERAIEIGDAALKSAATRNALVGDRTVQQLLSGIYFFRVHDHIEEIALIHLLDEFIQEHPKVKVVIIDSIAFHFRYDFTDMALRTRLLNGLSQTLIKLATKWQLAIVLMNQMTTKFRNEDGRDQSVLAPALGESWGHASNVRVLLQWKNDIRQAHILKSPWGARATVPYCVSGEGIRDLPTTVAQHEPPAKRSKTNN